jgi:hypothetical protein
VSHILKDTILKNQPEDIRDALLILLGPHFNPVFGACKIIEHEVAAINALQKLGLLSAAPDAFELIEKLRVTKAKATSLLYQVELRRSLDDKAWDARIKQVFIMPTLAKDGNFFLLAVDNPLLKEVIRERFKKLHIAVDDTSSPSLLRIPEHAFMKLVVDVMTDGEKAKAKTILIKAGVTVSKLQGLAEGLLKAFGEKFAGEAGGELGRSAAKWLAGFFAEKEAQV